MERESSLKILGRNNSRKGKPLILTGARLVGKTWLMTAVVVVCGMGALAGENAWTAKEQDAAWTRSWWRPRFEEKLKAVRDGAKPRVVFVGDSITHFWEREKDGGIATWRKYFAGEPYTALNLGFSGDKTQHVIWRIEHGALDGLSPAAVVLMIGTNNVGFDKARADEPPLDTLLGVRAVIKAIRARLPGARIILCALLPSGPAPDFPHRLRTDAVNRELWRLANGREVVWCDFSEDFLMPDETLSRELMVDPDRVHPTVRGYEIWAGAMIPQLNEILDGGNRPIAPRLPGGIAPRLYARHTPHTVNATSRMDEDDWCEKVRLARQRVVDDEVKTYDVVLLGDEHGAATPAPGKRVLDLRIPGDRTEHILWRVRCGALEGFTAKEIALSAGGNNGTDAGETKDDIAQGVAAIREEIRRHQPQAKITEARR